MLGGRKSVINYNHSYVCYVSKVYYRGSGNELILYIHSLVPKALYRVNSCYKMAEKIPWKS